MEKKRQQSRCALFAFIVIATALQVDGFSGLQKRERRATLTTPRDGTSFWNPSRIQQSALWMYDGDYSETEALYDEYTEPESSSSVQSRPKRVRPKRPSLKRRGRERKETSTPPNKMVDDSFLSSINFENASTLEDNPVSLSIPTQKALSGMGLDRMTEIQAAVFPQILDGASVLGRAPTGTGKTLAFLLPLLERLQAMSMAEFVPGQTIGVLVVVPTRELGIQIAQQAEQLFHQYPTYSVFCMYGGTKMGRDRNVFRKQIPTILVTTPGRLLDHIREDTKLVKQRFCGCLRKIPTVVLDECDRLLVDFLPEIEKLAQFLPRKRQMLLFSATLPKRKLVNTILAQDDEVTIVDCSDEQKQTVTGSEHRVPIQIQQTFMVLDDTRDYIATMLGVLQQHQQSQNNNAKIVVFLPTTKLVAYCYKLFTYLGLKSLPKTVLEMHSQRTQSARQRSAETFRNTKSAILFTTDVSARGIDYPDISLVLQFGLPESSQVYQHRVGRTGRAGKTGTGVLVLLPFESNHVHNVGPTMKRVSLPEPLCGDEQTKLDNAMSRTRSGDLLLTGPAEAAFRSFLAYYVDRCERLCLGLDRLVFEANALSDSMGLVRPPALTATVADRLKLTSVSGITVEKEE